MEPHELSDKQRFWLGHLQACEDAGISMKAYAERHGLELQQFYFRKGELKKLGIVGGHQKQPSTVLVTTDFSPPAPAKNDRKIRIELPNDVSIELPGAFTRMLWRPSLN
jgi:hypothetical protein